MVAVIQRRTSPSAYRSRGVAGFALVLLIVATLGHRLGFYPAPPFYWMLAIVVALALIALLLALAGFADLWERGDRGGKAALSGMILAFVVLAPFAVAGYRFTTYPRLVDITTDPADPPRMRSAETLRTPEMNALKAPDGAAAEMQREHYPAVLGRRYGIPAERVYEIAVELVEERGWQVPGSSRAFVPPSVTYEAVAHSPVFAFPSDVAIRVAREGGSTVVDMRAASRYGVHDFGTNAELIGSFLDELDRRIGAAPTS